MKAERVLSDVRSPELLGKKPILGLLMVLFGGLIFIVLAFNLVTHGPLIKWDVPVAESFHALALKSPTFVIDTMIAGYYIGKEGIVVATVLLALYFLYKRFWLELVMVAISLGIGGLLFKFLSHVFNRPRPFLLFDTPIWPGSPNIPGFPSGHTLNIVILCGFLVYVLVPKMKSFRGKALVILVASLAAVYIGFSRLYVGDHYLTDIIAGYAVGIAWFGLACTCVELLFQRYISQKMFTNSSQ